MGFLVVFLGNPGKEYASTRHNYAWRLADRLGTALPWTEKFKGSVAPVPGPGGMGWYLKPHTFMNLSGESAQKALAFYKLTPEKILAVHDDLELNLGQFKFQKGGGLGGHNGLRSLEKHLSTRDFCRLRLGIGRPLRGDVSSHVLGRFTPDEEITVDQTLDSLEKAWGEILIKL